MLSIYIKRYLKLEEDKRLIGIPFPNGITRESLIRLKRRILKQYGYKIAGAAFPNYKQDDMIRQTASSVIRQSMVQPDYKLTNTAKHPIGFPTQETTSIVEEQKESTNMDDPRTSF